MRYHCMEGMGIISSLIKLSSHLQDAPHLSCMLMGEIASFGRNCGGAEKLIKVGFRKGIF